MNQILSQYLIDSNDIRSLIKVATLVDPSSSPPMALFRFFFHICFELYHSIQKKAYAQCNHFGMFLTLDAMAIPQGVSFGDMYTLQAVVLLNSMGEFPLARKCLMHCEGRT
jgi:hypothetical protein